MSLSGTGLAVAAFLYLLPLVALVLIVRRTLKRSDRAAEDARAEPISREELERRYSKGRLSEEEYMTIREEISREERARGGGHGA